MLLRLVLWTAVFAAIGGCGGTTRIDLDGGLADGGVTSSGAITIEGESAIGIVPGESADFVARWLGEGCAFGQRKATTLSLWRRWVTR